MKESKVAAPRVHLTAESPCVARARGFLFSKDKTSERVSKERQKPHTNEKADRTDGEKETEADAGKSEGETQDVYRHERDEVEKPQASNLFEIAAFVEFRIEPTHQPDSKPPSQPKGDA